MKSTVTICLLVLALPLRARADSPEPLSLDYFVQVSGNTVIVCGLRQGEWIYRSGLTMLREDPANQATVQITDTVDAATLSCRPTTSGRTWYADGGLSCPTLNQPGDGDGDGANTCFIDECVPPGTWRYGIAEWADPNACEKSVRTNYAWAPAVVTDPVDGCVRSKTTTAPATWTGKMTWTDDRVACSKSYNPLGCSTVGAVLPMHFLAFLGGLAWLIHRRRLASP